MKIVSIAAIICMMACNTTKTPPAPVPKPPVVKDGPHRGSRHAEIWHRYEHDTAAVKIWTSTTPPGKDSTFVHGMYAVMTDSGLVVRFGDTTVAPRDTVRKNRDTLKMEW